MKKSEICKERRIQKEYKTFNNKGLRFINNIISDTLLSLFWRKVGASHLFLPLLFAYFRASFGAQRGGQEAAFFLTLYNKCKKNDHFFI